MILHLWSGLVNIGDNARPYYSIYGYNKDMSMRAAGAYLRLMRENLGISQAEVARRIGVSSSQVHRIEEGPGETRATLVASVAIAVQAEPEDILKLLSDENATEDTGHNLAKSRIASRLGQQSASQHIIVRSEIANLASKMTDFQLGKWVALGERILSE
jgi:transcriptional regulator with XRE-family HTH domain